MSRIQNRLYSSESKLIAILICILLLPIMLYSQSDSDTTRQYKLNLSAYPYVYYTPETQFAFGSGGVVTFYTKKDSLLNPSNVTFSGFYSTNKSYELSLVSNLYFARNRMASTIDIRYGHKVDRFYGIGNNTRDFGTEQYILGNVGGMIDFQIPPAIIISDRAGLVFEYKKYTIVDTKDNPHLNADIPLTGRVGGIVSGVGLVWIWDTRDQVFFPNHGGMTQAKALIYTKDLTSDYTFSWVEINARRYWAFAPDHVLAVQVYFNSVSGSPPFFKLPALGGSSIMRGYFQGRYRDYDYLAFQLEYRQYFWWRLGFVVFAGSGDVVGEITSLQIRNLKPSYGAGLRFLFDKEQKINLRMDIGFGKNTNGVYFGIEEAF